MFDFSDPNTFWLNVTNVGLGLVTLICVAVVGYSAVQEALVRYRNRKAIEADDHTFLAADLGLTMADGGERVEQSSQRASQNGVVEESAREQKRHPKK